MKNQVGDNVQQQINMKGGVGPSLAVWWFRLCPPKAEGMGSIPGWELRSPMPQGVAQKKREKEEKEEWNRAWIGSRTVTSN